MTTDTLQTHLAAAAKAVADLTELGVRVISVKVDLLYDWPRIHVGNPEPLLAHLDVVETNLVDLCYRQRAVRVAGCEVFWIVDAAPEWLPVTADELRAQLKKAAQQ
jgi:hypothetical protein